LSTLLLAGVDLPGIPANLKYYALVFVSPIVPFVVASRRRRCKRTQQPRPRQTPRALRPDAVQPVDRNELWQKRRRRLRQQQHSSSSYETFVLVNPTGVAKGDLVDPLFRDQIHVVAPVLDGLSLKKGICEFVGVKDEGLE